MNKEKQVKVYLPLALVVLLVSVAGVMWYRDYSRYITTDDAHIESDYVSVSPRLLGRISHLYFEEGDTVKSGTLLAELDTTELVAQRQQAEAMKSQADAGIKLADAKYQYDKKNVEVLSYGLKHAKDDFSRAKNQFAGQVISQEQYDHAKNTLETAKAQFDASNTQLKVSLAQIGSAQKTIESSEAQINVINTQINNTKLVAPFEGQISKKWLQAGDVVQPAQAIYTINNNKFRVIVYLEETKISNLKIGQNAEFTIDAFANKKFTGKIYAIGSVTASQFSLIPPNNASGNFTKITQRVPIKISIEPLEANAACKLLSGMSCILQLKSKIDYSLNLLRLTLAEGNQIY